METLKVKTSEFLGIRDELVNILSQEKLSFLAKFKISALYGELVAKIEPFETTRKDIVKHFGQLDEAGENYVVPEEKKEEFQKEMESVLNSTIEFEYEPLEISLIGHLESSNVYYQVFKLFKS